MSDLTKAFVMESGNYMTPKGRLLIYSNSLFEAQPPSKSVTDPKKFTFQGSILIPASADISALEDAIAEQIEENVSEKIRKTTKVKNPLLRTEDQEKLVEFADDYPVLIRCSSKFRPDVITPKGDRAYAEEEAPDEIYSGRWCRFTVRPYYWKHDEGGRGVSLGLANVQMLDHDDPMASGHVRGVTEFDAVEAGGLEDLE